MLNLVALEIVLELSHSRIILFVVSSIGQGNSLRCRPLTFFTVELFESLEIWLRILFAIKLTWCVLIHFGRGKRISVKSRTGIIGRRSFRARCVLDTILANCNLRKISKLQRGIPGCFLHTNVTFIQISFSLNLGRYSIFCTFFSRHFN